MQVALYWTLRSALFLLTYAVMWSLHWFDIFAVLFAFVVAWIVGYVAFPRLRKKAAAQMDGWITRGQRGIDADAEAEDEHSASEGPHSRA